MHPFNTVVNFKEIRQNLVDFNLKEGLFWIPTHRKWVD
jgi:hypothetical protein